MFDFRFLLLTSIASLSIATRAPAEVIHPAAIAQTASASSTETKTQPTPPLWLWWTTIALVPVGTMAGVWLGKRQTTSLRAGRGSNPEITASINQTVARTNDETDDQADKQNQADDPVDEVERSVPPLPQTLNSKAAHTRQTDLTATPLTATTRLSKVDIVETLIADLHSSDLTKRRKAIWELGQRADSRAMQPLVELIVDADSQQRSLILAAISEIGIRTLNPINRALLVSLQDDSADVRQNAIRDVTRIYDLIAQISQLLQLAASDKDAGVRETATWALNQLHRIRDVAQVEGQAVWSSHQAHSPLPSVQEGGALDR